MEAQTDVNVLPEKITKTENNLRSTQQESESICKLTESGEVPESGSELEDSIKSLRDSLKVLMPVLRESLKDEKQEPVSTSNTQQVPSESEQFAPSTVQTPSSPSEQADASISAQPEASASSVEPVVFGYTPAPRPFRRVPMADTPQQRIIQGQLGPPKLVKAILLGNVSVGKTSLLERYVSNKFDLSGISTIGLCPDQYNKNVTVRDCNINFVFTDTAGQERYGAILSSVCYRGIDCCILVFDLTSESSFRSLEFWRDQFISHAVFSNSEHFPFLVIGNKSDLDRKIPREYAEQLCRKWNALYCETSAKDGINVDKAFTSAVERVVDNVGREDFLLRRHIDEAYVNTVKLKPSKKQGGCC